MEGKLKTFQYGKDKIKDEVFLKSLRFRLTSTIREKLGINKISNKNLLSELDVLNKGIVEGSPRVEIIQKCPKVDPVVVEKEKECPPQKIREVVKEIYIDTCEDKQKNGQPVPVQIKCGLDQCIEISKDYCDQVISQMNL